MQDTGNFRLNVLSYWNSKLATVAKRSKCNFSRKRGAYHNEPTKNLKNEKYFPGCGSHPYHLSRRRKCPAEAGQPCNRGRVRLDDGQMGIMPPLSGRVAQRAEATWAPWWWHTAPAFAGINSGRYLQRCRPLMTLCWCPKSDKSFYNHVLINHFFCSWTNCYLFHRSSALCLASVSCFLSLWSLDVESKRMFCPC